MDKVIKEKDMNISILENKNDKLLAEIGKLQRIMLTKTASKSSKECRKLKEKLKNLNFRNRKYVGTMIMSLSVLNMF